MNLTCDKEIFAACDEKHTKEERKDASGVTPRAEQNRGNTNTRHLRRICHNCPAI
jgi:hypothetical protein